MVNGICLRLCYTVHDLFYKCVPPLIADVFKQGIWPEVGDTTDPELKVLAQSLPTTVLRSKVPATAKKYAGAFSRWRSWASSKTEVVPFPFPAKPFHVALYLNYLIQKSQTPSPVEEAVNALSWMQGFFQDFRQGGWQMR